MDESLEPVTSGALDVASLIAGLIGDVRLYLLHPELPAQRKVSLALALISEALGPPPPSGLPSWIEPGTDAAGVAAIWAHWLRGHPESYTAAAEMFSGAPRGSAVLKADGEPQRRPARDTERRRLSLAPGETVWLRGGWLVIGGVVAARTRLLLVPGRVPFMGELETSDVPFGTLAASAGGLRRAARAAWPSGGPGVESTALLFLGREPLPCGIAWEATLPEVIAAIAAAAAGLPRARLLRARELAGRGG